ENITAPIQIHYGTQDGKVLSGTPPEWSRKLNQGLLEAGKEVQLFQYERERHSFVGPAWFDFMGRTLRFFDKYVK
ncbi:MAG: alpha/beta hydrolase family protein, partial [Anaerolineales bacterium]